MPEKAEIPEFAVVSGGAVHRALRGRHREVIDLIEEAYLLHGSGSAVTPGSTFLRFADRPDARIIALPASVGGPAGADGIKWIASFPANVAAGIPRASAVLILNDRRTGYPYACVEGSIISATRTAASAAVAARALTRHRTLPRRLGFVGTGLIARYANEYLAALGWQFDSVAVHDLSSGTAASFGSHLAECWPDANVKTYDSAIDLLGASDLVVFATTATVPHIGTGEWLAHNPLVLHVSLRDLDIAVIEAAVNITDDRDHVLTANTSLHLAARNGTDPVAATLFDVLKGQFTPPADRPIVFSPFGLGILDLVLGNHVVNHAKAASDTIVVDDFFYDLDRHHPPGRPTGPG